MTTTVMLPPVFPHSLPGRYWGVDFEVDPLGRALGEVDEESAKAGESVGWWRRLGRSGLIEFGDSERVRAPRHRRAEAVIANHEETAGRRSKARLWGLILTPEGDWEVMVFDRHSQILAYCGRGWRFPRSLRRARIPDPYVFRRRSSVLGWLTEGILYGVKGSLNMAAWRASVRGSVARGILKSAIDEIQGVR